MAVHEEHEERTMPSIRRPPEIEDAGILERTKEQLRQIKQRLPAFVARRKQRLSSVPPNPILPAYSHPSR